MTSSRRKETLSHEVEADGPALDHVLSRHSEITFNDLPPAAPSLSGQFARWTLQAFVTFATVAVIFAAGYHSVAANTAKRAGLDAAQQKFYEAAAARELLQAEQLKRCGQAQQQVLYPIGQPRVSIPGPWSYTPAGPTPPTPGPVTDVPAEDLPTPVDEEREPESRVVEPTPAESEQVQ